jgi:hypothetical protein
MDDRLRSLTSMDTAALRAEWRRLYRASPPSRVRRDLLTRGIADKWQEAVLGGLPATFRRRLLALAEGGQEKDGVTRVQPTPRLRSGTRLLRTWRGRTMSVTVLDNGFLFEDRRYTSLTEVAHAITGSHWSGPRFFGLTKTGTPPNAR